MHPSLLLATKIRVVFFIVFLGAADANAATYYVDAAAPNDAGNGSSAAPKKTLNSGVGLMSVSGGDTLIVRSGRYSTPSDEITTVVNGTTGNYNTIKADTDGGVIITANLNLASTSAYVRFEGLKWESPLGKSIKGHHLKFLRCAFVGGPPNNNTTTLGIGTNDTTPGAQYILLEDVWAYGQGGRYNIIVFNSNKIILRRVVVRHDGGWSDTKNDPEAGITIYNSFDTQIQNGMVIDSNLVYHSWTSAFFNVKNGSTTNPHRDTKTVGSIALNNAGYGIGFDDSGPIENALVENSVIWNNGGGVSVNGGGGGGHTVTAKNLTIGRTGGHGFVSWSAFSTLGATNAIVYQNSGKAFGGSNPLTHSFNNCNGNVGGNCSGTGETNINPLNNGLKYLPRIEVASVLKTAGVGGAQLGVESVKRIGASETLFGDPGFDSLTNDNLWPWPHQQRIKKEMCVDAGVTRGFCNSPSLTHYIWEYLGNPCPVEICGANTPTVSLSALPFSVPSGGSTTLSWSTANAASCAASDAWSGTKATNNNVLIGVLTTTSTFTLTCTGPGGSSAQSATVTVTQ